MWETFQRTNRGRGGRQLNCDASVTVIGYRVAFNVAAAKACGLSHGDRVSVHLDQDEGVLAFGRNPESKGWKISTTSGTAVVHLCWFFNRIQNVPDGRYFLRPFDHGGQTIHGFDLPASVRPRSIELEAARGRED